MDYSTLVLDKNHPFAKAKLRDGEVDDERGILRISTHTFVTAKHRQGLLPEIVKHLQDCRTRAKAALKKAKDPMEYQVCDARQLAFKIAGNGMYGALGSSLSLLPLMAIAESVTALGRLDLLTVRRIALETYPDAEVVYGDTDSIFVAYSLAPEIAGDTIAAVTHASELTVALAKKINGVMRAPTSIEFEKILSVFLLLTKKRYAAIKYAAGFKFGVDTPELLIKGLQSVRRDGCPLVRDLVRDVVASILESGTDVDAAALVRRRLLDVVEDKAPLEWYITKKTLRKTLQDCSKPMTARELQEIRRAIGAPASLEGPLTYAEEDAAILAKVPLPYRARVRLPHVMLAHRMRLKDPGSSPVCGQNVSYVVTYNGGNGKIYDAVEAAEDVVARHIPVDRAYYLKALRTPVNNIFGPVAAQRLLAQHKSLREGPKKDLERAVDAELDLKLWRVLRGRALEEEPETKRARIAASPLARAFARQAATTTATPKQS